MAEGSAGRPSPPGPVPGGRSSAASGSIQVAEVQFKGVRTDYYSFRPDEGAPPLRDLEYVVVQADRGRDVGFVKRVAFGHELQCEGGCELGGDHPVTPPQRRVLRRASPVDVDRILVLREEEPDACRTTRKLVKKHGLKMKVSDAEWQWDRKKLTVYFTAEKRVDFRELVREMARTFHTRIELRQIGVRDEARRVGGIGRCRRELCCRTWLRDLEPVTLQIAKDQGLSLNPAQISGACGRLMNCLHYEHEQYVQARKRFPRKGQELETSRGTEEVVAWNLFRETVSLRDRHGDTRIIPLEQLRGETGAGRPGVGEATTNGSRGAEEGRA